MPQGEVEWRPRFKSCYMLKTFLGLSVFLCAVVTFETQEHPAPVAREANESDVRQLDKKIRQADYSGTFHGEAIHNKSIIGEVWEKAAQDWKILYFQETKLK